MLVHRAGHLVTQAELLQGVWGPDAVHKTHYLRVQLAAIRRKVEPDPAHPRYFITAPGLGLRFDPRAADRVQPC
jgi:two-component system KDP operon response regulator KdpE